MRRLAAALLAMLIAICVSLAVIMLILWLRHGDANVNDPEIIKIGSNATMGAMLFAFFRAWRNPDSFFSFFQKIPNLLKPTSLNIPLKRLMSLVFIAGFMISLMTFAIYVINDNSRFIRSSEKFFEHVIFGDYVYRSYPAFFWIGLVITIIGLLGSFLCDKVLGKIVTWVKSS